MANKIEFLGTGTSQGVPMIGCGCDVCRSDDFHDKRLRTSAYVEYEGLRLVIDAGPDFRQQMLRSGIKELDAVLLTHMHKDHTGGLDDVRAFNYFTGKGFPIYAETAVQESLERLKGVDVFVISCIRREKHISHFSLDEALEVCRKVGATHSFLTHISHQLERYEELCKVLPEGVEPAYDGLSIAF